jgi:hypothetical protein
MKIAFIFHLMGQFADIFQEVFMNRFIALVMIILLVLCGCNPKAKLEQKTSSLENSNCVTDSKEDIESTDYVNVKSSNSYNYSAGSIVAMDDLGRSLPLAGETPTLGKDKKREVGIMYEPWISTISGDWANKLSAGPFMFKDVLLKNPDPTKSTDNPPWTGGVGPYYHGEPLLGFYTASDTWVLRKHAIMLTLANLDFIMIDVTNHHPYITESLKLMKILDEYRQQGWNVPKIAFYTNNGSAKRMLQLYENIYSVNKYPDIWYKMDGKPLIIGDPDNASPIIKDFFTIRRSQWPTDSPKTGGFPWIEFGEQRVFADENGKNKVISVSVAQNSSKYNCFGDSIFYGDTTNKGRSYHNGAANITEDSYKYGHNFQEQWDNAIKSDAEIAFVECWNEWIAGAFSLGDSFRKNQPITIWDAITPEYSRDIEPARGGYFDNYYMQLVNNIRRFKGATDNVVQSKNVTIDLKKEFGQWNKVDITYGGFMNASDKRDALAVGGKRNINHTGRNGLLYSKIAQDENYLYFYIQTQNEISPYKSSEGTWMNLYLNINGYNGINWKGYNYVVNQKATSDTKSTLAKFDGKEFKSGAEINYRVLKNQMMISVSKKDLGLSGNNISFEFKWVDSKNATTSIEDFYTNGDSLPYGRFNYVFNGK